MLTTLPHLYRNMRCQESQFSLPFRSSLQSIYISPTFWLEELFICFSLCASLDVSFWCSHLPSAGGFLVSACLDKNILLITCKLWYSKESFHSSIIVIFLATGFKLRVMNAPAAVRRSTLINFPFFMTSAINTANLQMSNSFSAPLIFHILSNLENFPLLRSVSRQLHTAEARADFAKTLPYCSRVPRACSCQVALVYVCACLRLHARVFWCQCVGADVGAGR